MDTFTTNIQLVYVLAAACFVYGLHLMNSPATVPTAASNAFSRNISALLLHMTAEGELQIDTTDEIQAGVVITRDGEVVQPAVAKLLQESLHHEGASLVDRPGH